MKEKTKETENFSGVFPKNCLGIIVKYLEENGFDGLYNDNECGCELSDIVPCDGDALWCKPGYKVVPPDNVKCDFDFYICDSKDATPWDSEE